MYHLRFGDDKVGFNYLVEFEDSMNGDGIAKVQQMGRASFGLPEKSFSLTGKSVNERKSFVLEHLKGWEQHCGLSGRWIEVDDETNSSTVQ